MNLFYQVFDKGMLSDGEGRNIDFSNTIIFLTSNLGSDIMTELSMRPERPTRQQVVDAIRPSLIQHFKPALLARMKVVPYFPLSSSSLRSIVALKTRKIQERIKQTHGLSLTMSDEVLTQVAERCNEVDSGARNTDHILSRTLLPLISRAMLDQMANGALPREMRVELSKDKTGYEIQMT